MSYITIKLKGGKTGIVYLQQMWCSINCIWCGKEIKANKVAFEAEGSNQLRCCSMVHAKAYMNSKI
jgi:hypothetical protein